MSELNKIAQEMFGENYAQLSAFAQHSVRLEVARTPAAIANYEKGKLLDSYAARIVELENDLKDAWDENEDLQLELLRRDEEDELRDTRSTRARQEQARVDDPGATASLEDIRGRGESGVPGEVRSGATNGLPS